MEFRVGFNGIYKEDGSQKEVVVDAVDRWEAVVKAVDELKLSRSYSLNFWAAQSSVKKLDRKKRLSWWEKLRLEEPVPGLVAEVSSEAAPSVEVEETPTKPVVRRRTRATSPPKPVAKSLGLEEGE